MAQMVIVLTTKMMIGQLLPEALCRGVGGTHMLGIWGCAKISKKKSKQPFIFEEEKSLEMEGFRPRDEHPVEK